MFPKQLMSLDGGQSMLQSTITRLSPLVDNSGIWVVTGAELVSGAGYREISHFNHMVEPTGRNTAPAIGVMAAYLADFAEDPIMLVLPADHAISDVPAFHTAIKAAAAAAQQGRLVTFGITPTYPETGYGYIKTGAPFTEGSLTVERFVEKPDQATAESYLKQGGFYWNSGMFVAKASVMLEEITRHAPQLAQGLSTIREAWKANGGDWRAAVASHFGDLPSESFDYAVMEKSDNVVLIPCNIGWSDVGSWEAVQTLAEKDANGNTLAPADIAIDTRNTLVMSHGQRLVATIGVEDLCIIDTADALLVTHRNQSQKVKAVVDELKARNNGESHIIHRTAYRPWGSYTVLQDDTSGYKIKRIDVVPGGRLSLQSHKHRSEHWVVVTGTATVTNGDNILTLATGQSTYIPQGEKHRLENKSDQHLQIVEVQVGTYLGEDDIVRFDDLYGRQ